MTASTIRLDRSTTTIQYALSDCSLGKMLIAFTDAGICAIYLGDDPTELIDELKLRFKHARCEVAVAGFEEWMDDLVNYLNAPEQDLQLPLAISGTPFQQRVWQALQMVPRGQTITYLQLAERIGQPAAARAVAAACAANPVAIVIPCHRVIRSDGSLSGYYWGTHRKKRLLEIEQQNSIP